jgi:hypothetical protein
MRILLSLVTATALLALPGAVTATPAYYGSTVRCRYDITAAGQLGWTEADLTRIRVTPPEMYAQSGTQAVGWGFTVRRSMHNEDGPWRLVRRSQIQMGSATTSSPAAFSPMRTGIRIPAIDEPEFVHYHVVLKLFWFKGDGTVTTKISYAMPFITHRVRNANDGAGDNRGGGYCPGRLLQFT